MRKIAAFALLIVLLLGNALAAVSLRMDGMAALLAEDGAKIVPVGAYADIVALGGDRFAASPDGELYALMNARGEVLTDAVYAEFRVRGDVLLARRDGFWGLMGPDGAELGAFGYIRIETDGAEGRWALAGDAQDALLLLDASGGARDSGLRVRRIGEAAEGLLPVQLTDGMWGCCDAAGQMAIPAIYDYVGSFATGRAAAVYGGLYGAIDREGAWIADPIYDFLEISKEGFLLAADADGAHLLDADGAEFAAYSGEDIHAAIVGAGYVIGDGEALRVYGADGVLREELTPDAAVSEGVGEQLVLSEGMWGETCVRLLGTDAVYQNLYPLGTAGGEPVYACMEVKAARYANDLLKEIQISVDMDTARYGVVNSRGEQILPCHYRYIAYLADDRFLVRTARQWQMIDSRGRILWYRRVRQTEAPNS